MINTAITLTDFVRAYRSELCVDDIHPAAAASIHHALNDMQTAAELGDAECVASLIEDINLRIAREREW